MSARVVAAACAAMLMSGCSDGGASDPGGDGRSEAAAPRAVPEPSGQPAARASPGQPPERPFEPPTAGEEASIPAGMVQLGSEPGTVGRDARGEADLEPVRVPAFHIDRLPYPNDPDAPPRTDLTREQAAELCAGHGKRLCTEVEWERACKGDGVGPFPGGGELDVARCRDAPRSCASPFGVVGLGARVAEWTSSDAGEGLVRGEATAVVRGARAQADATAHRCGARRAADPTTHSETTGFRCCRGARPDVRYPEPPVLRPFVEKDVPAARLREIMASLPALEPWAEGFDPRGPMGVAAALGESEPPEVAPNGWAASTAPVLRWSPVRGEEAWVTTGTEGGSTILAVIQPTRDGFVHAASFVLAGEERPIAILHTPASRTKLQWTACWSCTGESGTIDYNADEGTFSVVQL